MSINTECDKKLLEAQYYHGLLPREDIKAMLRSNGDFLVRSSEPTAGQSRAFILSVMVQQELNDEGIKHFVFQRIGAKYTIGLWSFNSIPEMVDHHLSRQDSISKTSDQAVLKKAITRQKWELTHEEIEVTKKLGEGAFGEVCLGRWNRKATGEVIDVAIKLAKLEALTKEQVKDIMHEARLMRIFSHPNVIRIYGVAALQEPLMLVMELASDGALDSYLRKFFVSLPIKRDMCAGACFGLEYLHNVCNVIHRDIAARNCLYGKGQVKISDFGLTREGPVYQMNPSKRVPIRYLAPETMKSATYSFKSDVFSYGILCWEIFSQAALPYDGMSVAELTTKVKSGYRMSFPQDVPVEIVTVIDQKCWPGDPNERYTMTDIRKFWEKAFGIRRPTTHRQKGVTPTATAKARGESSRERSGRQSKKERRAKKTGKADSRRYS